MFCTGLADDLLGLNAWQKLLGQSGAAILAYAAGVQITWVAGYSMPSWLNCPITLVWLIGCANAFNLIDGVDGLASGVGLFATVTTLVAGLMQPNIPLVLATAPLAGALLGFLRYNFSPASIFLGDCGSLFIGFILGCYAVIWSQQSATLLGMTAPLMALAIPLLDTGLAIVRRFLRRQPILAGDRGHIHHRLLDRGFSPRTVALLLYGVCSIAALFSIFALSDRYTGIVIVVFCGMAWIGIQHLGYAEFGAARQLLAQRTFRRILDTQISIDGLEQALTRAETVDHYWEIIRGASRLFGFAHVRLRLNGDIFEEYMNDPEGIAHWTVRIPLSDGDYINLTHECDSGNDSLLVLSTLAGMLRRRLNERTPTSSIAQTELVAEGQR
jgi:UDP-GlcNAc:undecaprenyl-phosphate GlcNAc-1-phosphate transferase